MTGVTFESIANTTDQRRTFQWRCFVMLYKMAQFNFESPIDIWLPKTKTVKKYYNVSLFLITESQRTFEIT